MLKDIFQIKKVYGKPISEYNSGMLPYVTGSESNNGVTGYVSAPSEAISEGNCISVDPIKGFSRYQPKPFVGRGFSGASINLLYNKYLNEKRALYVCAAIEKIATPIAAYTNLFNSKKLEHACIDLPIVNGQIDWNLMEKIISAVQKQCIKRMNMAQFSI